MPPEGKAPAAARRRQLFMAGAGNSGRCFSLLFARHSVSVQASFSQANKAGFLHKQKLRAARGRSKRGVFLSTPSLFCHP